MAEGEGLVGVPANLTKERGPVAFDEDGKRNGTSRRDDGQSFPGSLQLYVGYCPHAVTVYNRATDMGLIYPHYEYYSTATEWGRYPSYILHQEQPKSCASQGSQEVLP